MGLYAEAFAQSVDDPDEFWLHAAKAVDWYTAPTVALGRRSETQYQWFPGATLNTSFNALDRHVDAGHGDRPALIWDSAMTGVSRTFSYSDLLAEVSTFAGALRERGVTAGDRVIIYMPMIPEAAIAMLACARIGAVHSVVFGGFAPAELAARIDDARPTVVIAASSGVERDRVVPYKPLLDEALKRSQHQPERCLVVQREQGPAELGERDLDWAVAMRPGAVEPAAVVPVEATDPLYVLYTSGTTGRPKGVVRDTGGYAVALRWSMTNIFGLRPGDVWFTASDVGWVVGHSYIVYAPLLTGCTTVLYEGKPVGTPDAGEFWRIVERDRVVGMFTAPTAIRAIKRRTPTAS